VGLRPTRSTTCREASTADPDRMIMQNGAGGNIVGGNIVEAACSAPYPSPEPWMLQQAQSSRSSSRPFPWRHRRRIRTRCARFLWLPRLRTMRNGMNVKRWRGSGERRRARRAMAISLRVASGMRLPLPECVFLFPALACACRVRDRALNHDLDPAGKSARARSRADRRHRLSAGLRPERESRPLGPRGGGGGHGPAPIRSNWS
jgi:hypothetical protein